MGAPLGNFNALRHGKRSKRVRAERMAAARAVFEEERLRSDAWIATRPQTDYGAIVDGLRALRRGKEAEAG